MANSKFRLSNIIANTLFSNLKNMKKSRKPKPKKQQSPLSSAESQKPSYTHINRGNKFCKSPRNPKILDTQFPDSPRKSNRKSRKSICKPISSVSTKRSSPHCSWSSSSASDIIFDIRESSDTEIPNNNVIRSKKITEKYYSSGVRAAENKPQLPRKKFKGHETFVMVKLSTDPEKDFRESMMEMIEENNIRESKDLEELLASFLVLNSAEYYGVIVKAFEQVWFNMSHPNM